jgi:hypothetical protein
MWNLKSQNDTKIFSDTLQDTIHVGSKRGFKFIPKEGIGRIRWVMYEFRLDGTYANTTNNVSHLLSVFLKLIFLRCFVFLVFLNQLIS